LGPSHQGMGASATQGRQRGRGLAQMFGTGAPEAIIILAVALLLFGPAVLTFWLGYTLGQKRTGDTETAPADDGADAADEGSEESTDE
jgi:Sec-independent protein translocase protein TatA